MKKLTAEEYFNNWKEEQPFGHIPSTFDGDSLMTGSNAIKFAEDFHRAKLKESTKQL